MKSQTIPSHYYIVETADWTSILQARKKGITWDNLRTRNGFTALGMAIYENSPLAVRMLLEMGCPIQTEYVNNKSFSYIGETLEKKQPKNLSLLLQAGADPNEYIEDMGFPIDYASEHALQEETILLCKHGCIPNTSTKPSPLWHWIQNLTPQFKEENQKWIFPDSEPILALLKCGARIDTEDSSFLNEIEFAKKKWLQFPLSKDELQKIEITLSLMEKNLFIHSLSDKFIGQKEIKQQRKI